MPIESHPIKSREEWLALRRLDCTASDIAAVCGCSPHKTALMLWAEKTGAAPDEADNALMRRGRHFESGIIEAIKEAKPDWKIERPNVYLRDPDLRIGATPDAWRVGDHGKPIATVQAKLVAAPVYADRWASGPPFYYVLQALTEAMLVGVDHAWLAPYVIGTFSGELAPLVKIKRHPSAEMRIVGAVQQFWDDVAAERTPQADYSRDGQLLALLKPPSERVPPLDLSTDNYLMDRLAEHEQLKDEISAMAVEKEKIRAEIIDKLNGAPKATAGEFSVSYKMTHTKAYSVAAKDAPRLTITKRKTQEKAA